MGAAPVRGSRDFAHIGHTLACRAVLSDLRSAAFTRFPHGSVVKGAPDNAGEPGSIPGLGRPPGGGNAVHSRILAWRIPGTEEPGGLQSMGSQKSQTQLKRLSAHTPVFLPGKFHRQRSLVGYSPWGLKRVGDDLVTKQQHNVVIMLQYTNVSNQCL